MAEVKEFDLLIAGGGLAGTSIACALDSVGISTAIIESVAMDASSQPSFDDRAIALAWGSRRIFEGIGIWDAIMPTATPIHHIHISEKGRFGQAHLDAEEESVEALGYVALARDIGHALHQRMLESKVHRFCPATLIDFKTGNDKVMATIQAHGNTETVTAKLLIAADGKESGIRQALGIESRESAYNQAAIVSNLLPGKPHNNIAYERFTTEGPLALLPMTDNRFGVVLTVPQEQVEEYLALDDAAFIEQVQKRIGFRCGRFHQAGKRASYPLVLMRTEEITAQRVALVGNAAHALHPISGQGFNLGLRDIATLVDVVTDAIKQGEDPGSEAVLQKYAKWRKQDVRSITLATDGLARIFSNPLVGVGTARSAGLVATDLLPGLRHRIARHAMGVLGKQPRLGRGLPL